MENSIPFSLPLTAEPFILSADMVKNATDKSVQRKRDWFIPTLSQLSFENSTLRLLVSKNQRSFELTIHIEAHLLQITCSCGGVQETLCEHAYRALESLTWLGNTSYFREFQPGGIAETARHYPHYFQPDSQDRIKRLVTKPAIGAVYFLSEAIDSSSFRQIAQLPGSSQPPPLPLKETAITYCLIHAYRQERPPYLLPCLGYSNKSGTEIKGFQQFLTGITKTDAPYLTEDQLALNIQCLALYKLAEQLPGSLLTGKPADQQNMDAILQLWKAAIPLLQQQQFLYIATLYRTRDLKSKPSKQNMERVIVQGITPRLQFQLTDRHDFFEFTLKISLQGRQVDDYCSDLLFFIQEKENLYLLPTLRDAALVEWMAQHQNIITIFKSHFQAFEQEFLETIRPYYSIIQVQGQPPKTLKKIR